MHATADLGKSNRMCALVYRFGIYIIAPEIDLGEYDVLLDVYEFARISY